MIADRTQISDEVSRLIALQTEFYKKSAPTPEQVQEFEWAGRRIRILFAELAQHKAARMVSLLPNRMHPVAAI